MNPKEYFIGMTPTQAFIKADQYIELEYMYVDETRRGIVTKRHYYNLIREFLDGCKFKVIWQAIPKGTEWNISIGQQISEEMFIARVKITRWHNVLRDLNYALNDDCIEWQDELMKVVPCKSIQRLRAEEQIEFSNMNSNGPEED